MYSGKNTVALQYLESCSNGFKKYASKGMHEVSNSVLRINFFVINDFPVSFLFYFPSVQ